MTFSESGEYGYRREQVLQEGNLKYIYCSLIHILLLIIYLTIFTKTKQLKQSVHCNTCNTTRKVQTAYLVVKLMNHFLHE